MNSELDFFECGSGVLGKNGVEVSGDKCGFCNEKINRVNVVT